MELEDEIRALEVARATEVLNFDVLLSTHVGPVVAIQAKGTPRPGTTLRHAAEVIRVAGEFLHADEIVRRLQLLGIDVSKPSLVASLHRRAAAGEYFQRAANRRNTFGIIGMRDQPSTPAAASRKRRQPRR